MTHGSQLLKTSEIFFQTRISATRGAILSPEWWTHWQKQITFSNLKMDSGNFLYEPTGQVFFLCIWTKIYALQSFQSMFWTLNIVSNTFLFFFVRGESYTGRTGESCHPLEQTRLLCWLLARLHEVFQSVQALHQDTLRPPRAPLAGVPARRVSNILTEKKLFGYGGPTDPISLCRTYIFFLVDCREKEKSYGKKIIKILQTVQKLWFCSIYHRIGSNIAH